jgi:hypothetical protein
VKKSARGEEEDHAGAVNSQGQAFSQVTMGQKQKDNQPKKRGYCPNKVGYGAKWLFKVLM